MKKLILLFSLILGVFCMNAQTQNDTTSYRYDMVIKVYPKPSQTITASQGKVLKLMIEYKILKLLLGSNFIMNNEIRKNKKRNKRLFFFL